MPLEAVELLTSNLALIERAIAFACRRYRFDPDDAEEFAAVVKLRLVDNDYAILRSYEERCKFVTFINIVIQRMALDYRIHEWGKWHASAEAKRLGVLAVELEQLLHRDGRSLDEALVALAPKHASVTRESLMALSEKLPARTPRRREVNLEEADSVVALRSENVEEPLMEKERRRTSQQISAVMAGVIERMPEDERLILQLRFEGGMTVAQIARVLHLDQKLLYRRLERRMRDIRTQLESAGLDPADVLDLIGSDAAELHFDLGKLTARPSIAIDETVAEVSEGPQ